MLAPTYRNSANNCYELEGDPYPEEPVYRSVAFGSSCTATALKFGGEDLWDAQPLGLVKKDMESFDFDRVGRNSQTEFMQSDFPPLLPQDPFFQLEVTTAFIDAEDAAVVGNSLLAFLGTVAANVLKVNTRKFTVKAAVLCDGLTCAMKVRVYSLGFPRFALEFQRYSGDCLAYNKTFQQAVQYFTSEATPTSSTLPAIKVDKDLAIEDLTPVLDAACRSNEIFLQAEAAASLSAISELSAEICHVPDVRNAILQLLRVSCFSVAAHLSQLLSNLALCKDAEDHFFRNGFLAQVFVQALTASTGRLLKERLAEAMKSLVARCRTELSKEAFDKLNNALEASKENEAWSTASNHEAIKSAAQLLPAPPNY